MAEVQSRGRGSGGFGPCCYALAELLFSDVIVGMGGGSLFALLKECVDERGVLGSVCTVKDGCCGGRIASEVDKVVERWDGKGCSVRLSEVMSVAIDEYLFEFFGVCDGSPFFPCVHIALEVKLVVVVNWDIDGSYTCFVVGVDRVA